VHSRPGEQASEAPSIEILHQETGDNVFGERIGATARLYSSSSSPICILFISLDDINPVTMGDNHGGVAAVVPAFPVVPYVLLISYLSLALVPFADLLDVLVCMCVVKLTSAYLLLTSIIKLTRKLLNILTIQNPYMITQFSPAGFAAALKPSPFMGSHFKRWQNKTLL
jgi:hypothetical protein